jgi:hypothetical protein
MCCLSECRHHCHPACMQAACNPSMLPACRPSAASWKTATCSPVITTPSCDHSALLIRWWPWCVDQCMLPVQKIIKNKLRLAASDPYVTQGLQNLHQRPPRRRSARSSTPATAPTLDVEIRILRVPQRPDRTLLAPIKFYARRCHCGKRAFIFNCTASHRDFSPNCTAS